MLRHGSFVSVCRGKDGWMRDSADRLGPIHLQASLHETLWGGQSLATVAGKALPPGVAIGETWETELTTVARNAAYVGRTLGELVATYGERLIGSRALEIFGPRFPLLAKFLDARQQLSVQVHPDDAYAAEHEGGKLGKTEVWYILRAEPGGAVVHGVRRPTSAAEVRAAIATNRLEDLLHVESVRTGDVIFVEAGTVHAIGAGVVLYELQEYSDITYRLYDYGRLQADGTPRALHVEQALAVMRYEPSPQTKVQSTVLADTRHRILAACRYFILQERRLDGMEHGHGDGTSCEIVTVLDGTLSVAAEGGSCALKVGETAVLPAEMGNYRIEGSAARFIYAYVPREDDAALRAWVDAQTVAVPK
jgi:mannose-6-phosphate isomerase